MATPESAASVAEPERELFVRPRVLVIGHTYQPPREFLLLSSEKRADIQSYWNERIYNECYKPVFQEGDLPDAFVFSLYGTLREWWKGEHPEGFELLKEKMGRVKDKEYKVLGDSYLHPILPLQSEENQDMLIKIGREAFREDFGFYPKGFWLPETAVSKKTLDVLYKNGYQFVALRDYQLRDSFENPMWVKVEGGEMAVIHCDSEISGSVSFQQGLTNRAEDFLGNFSHKSNISWMTDTEFYGHHVPFKDKFLQTVASKDFLSGQGLEVFDVQEALDGKRYYTEVVEDSSWSCSHELGRWKGECECDYPQAHTGEELERQVRDLAIKREMRSVLTSLGGEIDGRLSGNYGGWRDEFAEFFLNVRKQMYFAGDIEEAIGEQRLEPVKEVLFRANLARWTAETSCVWFFAEVEDGKKRPERDIARLNIEEAWNLLSKARILAENRR